ncbi:LAFA_0G03576g1_1 [Lachancea sp. 'fantastica']|nr:LAFA_0G03576g1_1 [Lachancea sp. 'fantastica']
MGPPGPSHRLGDKKAYHPGPRYASYRRPSPAMGSGPNPAHNPGAEANPAAIAGSEHSFNPNSRPRPSRYNPSVSSRPYSSSGSVSNGNGSQVNPRSGSRYSSDSGPSYQNNARGSSAHEIRRFSNGFPNYHHQHPSSSSTASRYNSSQYQTQSASKQGYHNYYKPPSFNRSRPSSVSDGHETASHGYSARGHNKWRDSYPFEYNEEHPSVSPAQTVPQLSDKSHSHGLSRYHNNLQPYSHRYTPYKNDRDTERVKKPSSISYENEHSLGSSLINSVPQTTRETEAMVATAHERIDLGRQKISERKPNNEEEYGKVEVTSPSTPDTAVKGEAAVPEKQLNETNTDANNEEAKFEQPIPITSSLKTEVLSSLGKSEQEISVGTVNELSLELRKEKSSVSTAVQPSTESGTEAKEKTVAAHKVTGCIFPMTEVQTKLWEIKNCNRNISTRAQKYRFKRPIVSLQEYPFLSQNIVVHEQAVKPVLLDFFRKLKRQERLKSLQLKKTFVDLDQKWSKICRKLEDISKDVKENECDSSVPADHSNEAQEHNFADERNQQNRAVSRRRNRADFVDDNEMENVLLQIDPDYKHHQLAAQIPPMILDPVEKEVIKFKDVNNLVTDKDLWASRSTSDAVDTFTPEEHELFVEAYLTYPKRFGRISQNMGGLRKPEECVLHYYRTKKETNYKQLLIDRNKKRKINAGRKRKEKEKERDSARPEDNGEILTDSNGLNESERDKTIDETEDEDVSQMTKDRPVDGGTEQEKPIPQGNSPALSATGAATNTMAVNLRREKEEETEAELETDSAVDASYGAASKIRDGNQDQEEHLSDNLAMNESTKRKIEELDEAGSDPLETSPIAPPAATEYKDHSAMDKASHSKNEDMEKAQQLRKKARNNDGFHKSSYWSVKETNMFPELLKEFGTQWALISEKLGTKSTTMVRNYFQRNAEQMGWQALAEGPNAMQHSGKEEESQEGTIPETHRDYVPPQQTPSVSIFNQSSRDASTPMQIPMLSTMDTFSQQSTPHGLPPPRLPSIQLHTQHTNVDTRKSLTGPAVLESSSGPSVHFAPSLSTSTSSVPNNVQSSGPSSSASSQQGAGSRRSSIKSLLNNETPIIQQPQPPILKAVELPSTNTSNAKIIVQELPPANEVPMFSVPTKSDRNPGSISSILNSAPAPQIDVSKGRLAFQGLQSPQGPSGPPRVAISQFPKPSLDLHSSIKPVLPPVPLQSASGLGPMTPSSRDFFTKKGPDFNFASDPLAALAAVASAPEVLTSYIPPDGRGSQHSPSG